MIELGKHILASLAKHQDSKHRNISRRDFSRQAAFGLGSLVALPSLNSARPDAINPLASQAAPNDQYQPSPESRAEIEARIQAILGKYGPRFTDGEKIMLRGFVVDFQRSLDRLRNYPLENWDEPIAIVRPLKTRPKRAAER